MMILLLLLVFIVPGCSSSNPAEPSRAEAASATPIVDVETARVSVRQLERSVEAVGTLDPNQEVTITNPVEGTIDHILVDLGDRVHSGQVVAELDSRELELSVRQQAAALQQELARLGLDDAVEAVDEETTSQVRQAEATFQEARIRLDRTRKLTQEGVVSKQQLDEQQARYDVAEAALVAARESVRNIRASVAARSAALALSEKKLADARIIAPIAGYVKDRLATEGEYLKANTPIATIVQNSPLKLRVEIPESSIASVRTGQSLQFTVDAFPDRKFHGRVSRLSPSVDQQSRTLKLEALVDNSNGVLKPGLFARVSIQTDRNDEVLVIPAQALFTIAGLEKVFVIENDKVAERPVRSGTRLDDHVEIVEGVKEGEVIATSNLGNLRHGQEVSIR